MKHLHFLSNSYEDTLGLGRRFARCLKKGDIVCLYGDLGTGKTAFAKGLARGFGVSPAAVHSPTFTLMNVYSGRISLYHFDLYRIQSGDLFDLGYEEFFYGQGIAMIEWAERLGALLPADAWKVDLRHKKEGQRDIYIGYHGERLKERFIRLPGQLT
jgi:tRNA threonylcarbamoyladenosine biosynthesis protein TsaE